MAEENDSIGEEAPKKKMDSPKDLLSSLTKIAMGKDALPQLKSNKEKEIEDSILNEGLSVLLEDESEKSEEAKVAAISQMEEFLKTTEDLVEPPAAEPQIVEEVIEEKIIDPNEPTGNVWHDTQIFFRQLAAAYSMRYEMWENHYTNILTILKKIYTVNKDNSDHLFMAVENIHQKLTEGLEKFITKRDEVERYAETDFKDVAKNLRKTLNLLTLQLKAFKLNEVVNEMYDIYAR